MKEQSLQDLASDLASALVLSNGRPEELARIGEMLQALEHALGATGEESLQRLATEAAALFEEAGEALHPQALQLAGLLAEEVQRLGEEGGEPAALAAVELALSAAAGLPRRVERDAEALELLGDFLAEAEEGLTRADETLLQGERRGFDTEKVAELFRIFHSLKGLAGHMAECRALCTLTHETESLLDLVRSGRLGLEGAVLEAVFKSIAASRTLLVAVRAAIDSGSEVANTSDLEPLLGLLRGLIAGEAAPREVPAAAEPADPHAEGAAQPAARPTGENSKLQETLRVGVERIDSLVEMIGELVIVESMVAHSPEITGLGSPRVRNYLGQLHRLSRDLQGAAMRLRMVTVRAVFTRMKRLVRELAKGSGKQAVLEISGEMTEMDRGMVEALEQPLVHLIRNAVDHGVESPEERERAGKPRVAALRLSACHQGGNIIIELSDDGAGLDRPAILKKARSMGLVGKAESAPNLEVDNFIFAPGFSTSLVVTELSGRGVGLDAVKRGVERMRGRVTVSSRAGQGTTFRLVLPLTLAIIDGMLVACGEERYIVPSLTIVEALQVREGMLFTMANRGELVRVRGDVIPAIRLGALLSVGAAGEGGAVAVLVESLGRRLALLVDAVLTQQQVVIKPLAEGVGRTELLSGAAILSDGHVGLILNVDRICSQVGHNAPGTQTLES